MKKGYEIRSRAFERKAINSRAKISAAIMLLCFFGLGYKVYTLQVVQHSVHYKAVKNNAIKELDTVPERGDILDRNGVVIANTRPMYDLVVIPERLSGYRKNRKKAVDDYVDMLAKFVAITGVERRIMTKRVLKSRSYKKVVLLRDLDNDKLSVVLENIAYLEGTSVQVKKVRHYPYGGAFLSPLGYVSRVDPSDMVTAKEKGYELISSDYTGKMGLEKTHNKALYGTIGKETVALDARGRVVERKIASRPVKGVSLELTLDADLQNLAH